MLPEELPLTPAELNRLFKAAGYTSHEKIARRLGVKRSIVSKWLSGKENLPPRRAAQIRELEPAFGSEETWNVYLAEVPATIALFTAIRVDPDPEALPAGPIAFDPLAVAEKLAPLLPKQDADELADKVAAKTKVDADELALNLAEVLPGKEEIAAQTGKATAELKKHIEEQTGKATIELKKHTEEQTGKATAEVNAHTEEQTKKVTAEVKAHTDGQTREQQRTVVSESRKSRRQMAGYAVGLAVLILGSQHFARPSMVVNVNGVSVERAQHAATNAPPASLGLPAPAIPTGARARVGRPVPKEPFKGQMQPPCGSFRAINGGCWLGGTDDSNNALRAPCPEEMYESAGYCFVPMGERGERLPSSLDGDP